MLQHFGTLEELTAAFPDEQTCIRHFRAIRWANGPFCPYCGGIKIYHFADDKTHKCGECRQRFSIKVGTIFEDTKLPLRKWFIAIWLITSHKKGIASTQLARDVGVTQKTAWFMTHRLREAAKTQSFNRPLSGEVEIDETFVGGKERNKHEWKRQHAGTGGTGKTAVFGMMERGGDIRAMKVDDLTAKTVHAKVVEHVEPGSNIMSDEFASYIGLEGRFYHHTVNHGFGEYVRDYFCHVNGLEGAWSHFKRQIFGIHHFISAKHLDRYLDEFTWRYNRRDAKGRRSRQRVARCRRRQAHHLSAVDRMTKKRDKPLHLDLSFDEALKRVAQTDPRELPREKKAKSKKRKRSSRPISKTSASPKPPVPSSK